MRNVSGILFLVFISIIVSSCSYDSPTGTFDFKVVKPLFGQHCQFEIGKAPVQTLFDLKNMKGEIGQILSADKNIEHQRRIDTEFIQSGNTFYPVDSTSLFAASLYYSLETSYLLFKNLSPDSADLLKINSNLSNTRIILDAEIQNDTTSDLGVTDNAAYYYDSEKDQDYFLTFPNEKIKEIPLGVNLGVITHEYTHLLFHHLFHKKNTLEIGKTKPTENTLNGYEEGMADYFAFIATQDPGFFLCSFPGESERDLSVSKNFTSEIIYSIEHETNSYDPHESGGVWASIQYEIGNSIGQENNAKSLVKLIPYLLTCSNTKTGNTLNLNFGDIAKCHQALLSQEGRNTSQVQQIYQKYLGSYR